MRTRLTTKPRDGRKSCGTFLAGATKRMFWGLIGLTVLTAGTSLAGQNDTVKIGVTHFRLGATQATFSSSNINDTKAALTAWAQNILIKKDSAFVGSDFVTVFEKTDELLRAYESRHVDGITLATEDFPRIRSQPDAVFLTYKNNSAFLRYAVLVQRSSGIEDVRQLKGRKVVFHSGPSMRLAVPWMDTLLASRSMGLSQHVLGDITRIEAAARAILQVFFRQADACVVALEMFKTACELNPQVGKDLKPLVVSPELIPTSFFFHPEYSFEDRSAIESVIKDLDKSPAGRQVLTVFQSEKLVKMPVSVLEATIALLAEHERIKRSEAMGGKSPQISQTTTLGKN